MTMYGFVVMAWLLAPSYSAPAIPFASMQACETARVKGSYDQCVDTGVKNNQPNTLTRKNVLPEHK